MEASKFKKLFRQILGVFLITLMVAAFDFVQLAVTKFRFAATNNIERLEGKYEAQKTAAFEITLIAITQGVVLISILRMKKST